MQLLRAARAMLSRHYGEHVLPLELHQGCRDSKGKVWLGVPA